MSHLRCRCPTLARSESIIHEMKTVIRTARPHEIAPPVRMTNTGALAIESRFAMMKHTNRPTMASCGMAHSARDQNGGFGSSGRCL